MTRITIQDIVQMKGKKQIAALTAYDFPTSVILEDAGVDLLLVGDSLGNAVYGFENTLPVTLDDMIRHTSAVSRGTKRALVVLDLPFGSYQSSISDAVKSATRSLAEGGAQAVKLEGGSHMAETIARLVEVGIPVMAHIGLTPQSIHQLSGYHTQGKQRSEADKLLSDAAAVTQAGAFSVVLECVQPDLARQITKEILIPTIGIGAGQHCDGQILVTHDLIGFTVSHVPKFVKQRANVRAVIYEAVKAYVSDIKGIENDRN